MGDKKYLTYIYRRKQSQKNTLILLHPVLHKFNIKRFLTCFSHSRCDATSIEECKAHLQVQLWPLGLGCPEIGETFRSPGRQNLPEMPTKYVTTVGVFPGAHQVIWRRLQI